jgi:DNA-binding NarL/FixJ family response regulator
VKAETISPSSTQLSTISVVVVEDDPSLREIISSWIQEADGFSFLGAFPDTECATSKVPSLGPNVAIVDINLPGLSGIECVRRF